MHHCYLSRFYWIFYFVPTRVVNGSIGLLKDIWNISAEIFFSFG